MVEKKKIIIDTDNGDDIDDLIALYFALHLKEQFELIGVVCSYLNAPLRKKQIEYAFKLHGVDIPIYVGVGKPVGGLHCCDTSVSYCQYFPYLGNAASYKEDEGVDFIISSAKKYKDKLTIVEIAPQCTLARAILKEKEALKETNIVMMGGCFARREGEWNIECDAFASKVVLESDLKLSYVGSDVTLLTTLEDEKIENLFLHDYLDSKYKFLSDCSNRWVECSKRHIVLHDPLALLTVIDHSICEFKEERISFARDDKGAYTVIDNDSSHIARIAKNVNLDKLYTYVYDLFLGAK